MPYIEHNGIPGYKRPGVYVITNKTNGKVYVGSATSIKGRLLYHRSYLRRGKHDNQHFQRAWDKYGESQFSFDILERCEASELLVKEQYWIDKLEATKRSNGYNICPVAGFAMLGRNHSEKSRKQMSEKRKGMDTSKATEAAALVNKGKKLTEEQCKERSERFKGVPKSEAHKEALKETHWTKRPDAAEIIARIAANQPKTHTQEHRRKISEGGKRRWAERRLQQREK